MAATSAVPARPDSNGSALVRDPIPAALTVAREPVELPSRPRLSGPVVAAIATLAGVTAMVVGATAFAASLRSNDADEAQATLPSRAAPISFLAKPSTQRLRVTGSGGRIILAVGSAGRGVLVLKGLGAAPEGKTYRAWVIRPTAKEPVSAAVFSGIERTVPLSVAVTPGAVVAIAIERADGGPAPTRAPKLVSEPAV